MRDRSTKSLPDFLIDSTLNGVLLVLMYRRILFRCLPGLSLGQSKALLWGLLAGSILLGGLLIFRYRRTEVTGAIATILPCGLYTMLAYARTVRRAVGTALIAAWALSLVYTLYVMLSKVESEDRQRVMRNRMYQCLCACHLFLAVGMAGLMTFLGAGRIFGVANLTAKEEAVSSSAGSIQTIADNLETLKVLQTGEWEKLTTEERLDVMQTVANIEAYFLGLPHELHVSAAELEENTLGSYVDAERTILFDLEHIEEDDPYEVLDTCCHEAYHSYEHRLVDAYLAADPGMKSLAMYRPAEIYISEFGHYVNNNDDFMEYYKQRCESDSRDYAAVAAAEYWHQIELYLNENDGT